MLMLITYDISLEDAAGQARLRRIAKHCLDYGVRVQYSVFECDVTPDQWVKLKAKYNASLSALSQPPSGGCVLKPHSAECKEKGATPAAFRRLCVETKTREMIYNCPIQPPSGGCVLKQKDNAIKKASWRQPPSGGCVLKHLLSAV